MNTGELHQMVEDLDPAERAKVLRAELAWFEEASKNAKALNELSSEYLRGFDAAIGWLKLHLKMAEEHGS
jgi:hypothetical protein